MNNLCPVGQVEIKAKSFPHLWGSYSMCLGQVGVNIIWKVLSVLHTSISIVLCQIFRMIMLGSFPAKTKNWNFDLDGNDVNKTCQIFAEDHVFLLELQRHQGLDPWFPNYGLQPTFLVFWKFLGLQDFG